MTFASPPSLRSMPRVTKSEPELQAGDFDLEAVLPVRQIREYTKTDDIPHVTDTMLELYRKAAFEAAEQYTGLLLSRREVITEYLRSQNVLRTLRRGAIKHNLQHTVSDGIVYLYGSADGTGDRMIQVEPGASSISIPLRGCDIDLSPCCNPCGNGDLGMRIMYQAGYTDPKKIPSGIILGCLKFIAWCIGNPGDEIMTVKNGDSANSTGIIGTNNGAWASGAIEQWRIYVKD